jgi:hypothetical protein
MRAVGLAAWRAAIPTNNIASPVGMAVTATSRSSLAKLKSTFAHPFFSLLSPLLAKRAKGAVKEAKTAA